MKIDSIIISAIILALAIVLNGGIYYMSVDGSQLYRINKFTGKMYFCVPKKCIKVPIISEPRD